MCGGVAHYHQSTRLSLGAVRTGMAAASQAVAARQKLCPADLAAGNDHDAPALRRILCRQPKFPLFESLDDRSDLCEGTRFRIDQFEMAGVGNGDLLPRIARRFSFRRVCAPKCRRHNRVQRPGNDFLGDADRQHLGWRSILKHIPRTAGYAAIEEINHPWSATHWRAFGAIGAKVVDSGEADYSSDGQRILAVELTRFRQPSARRRPQCELSS